MASLQECGMEILAALVFGLFPAWWLWTATILKALVREHKKVPQAIIATMWPNMYKQRGQGHYAFNSTITGFQVGQYVYGAIILGGFIFGVSVDFRKFFSFQTIAIDFIFPAAYLVVWFLPSYLLKRQINKMKPATTEWVDEWRL